MKRITVIFLCVFMLAALYGCRAEARAADTGGELSIDEALQSVREHINNSDPDALSYLEIGIDNETDNIYLIQAYQIVSPGGGGTGQTLTYNWYEVNKYTGEIKEMF